MSNKENLFYLTLVNKISSLRHTDYDFAKGRYDGLTSIIDVYGWLEEYKKIEFDFVFLCTAFWTEHYDLKYELGGCCSYPINEWYDLIDCLLDLKFFKLRDWVRLKIGGGGCDVADYIKWE